MTKLKIESTETGEVFNMRMESSIDKLKFQVSLLIPVPPHDQIMLIGPPYKILDSLYGPNLDVEGKRIFVFNRRILTDNAKEPQRIRLQPFDITKPDLSVGLERELVGSPREATVDKSQVAVAEFEVYFLTQLRKSQCLEQFIIESYKSCKTCVAQHQVQLDGIGAAISNLQYFHRSIDKTYVVLENQMIEQQARHAALIESFEPSLQNLSTVSLHPAIRAAVEGYYNSTLGTSTNSVILANPPGGSIVSLHDCIPAEKERAYLNQCAINHKKVDEDLQRVKGLHEEVAAGVRELLLPPVDFARLQDLLDAINQENTAMADLMRRFRRDYQFVYDHITMTTSPSPRGTSILDQQSEDVLAKMSTTEPAVPGAPDNDGDDEPQGLALGGAGGPIDGAFIDNTSMTSATESTLTSPVHPGDGTDIVLGELQRRKNSQEGGHYLDVLEACARRVREAKNEIERSQNWLLGAIYRTMRQIALLQTDIQYKLKRDVEWMKKLTQGHNEYFVHLERVQKLPIVYNHMLNEIARRRNYNTLFEAEVIAASDRIAAFRKDETKQREHFMQAYGVHIPPVFFKAIPTLKEKPPYFSPTLTDAQWLPEITYDDVNRSLISSDLQIGDLNQESKESVQRVLQSGASVDTGEGFVGKDTQKDTDSTTSGLKDVNSSAAIPAFQPGKLSEDVAHGGGSPNTIDSEIPESGLGGSVIFRAEPLVKLQNNEELLLKISRLEYENSQYIRIINELMAEKNNSSNRSRSRSNSEGMDMNLSVAHPPPVAQPTLSSASEPASKATVNARTVDYSTSAATASAERDAQSHADSLQQDSAKGKGSPSTRAINSPQLPVSGKTDELQGKLSKVGVLNQLMIGYAKLRDMVNADATTLSYIAELERQSSIPMPEDLESVYSGDETYIEQPSGAIRPIKDTIQSVMKSVHALVHSLGYHLNHPKVSFMDFQVGDVALFMKADPENRKIWMAFHAGAPNRFLAEESLQAFEARGKGKEPRVGIVGRIVFIDPHVATLSENPFNLAIGAEYYVCFVESMKGRPGRKKSANLVEGSGSTASQTPSSLRLDDPSVISPSSGRKEREKDV